MTADVSAAVTPRLDAIRPTPDIALPTPLMAAPAPFNAPPLILSDASPMSPNALTPAAPREPNFDFRTSTVPPMMDNPDLRELPTNDPTVLNGAAIVPATDLIRATVLSRFSSTGPISNRCDTSPIGALWKIPARVVAAVSPKLVNESFSFDVICPPRALASALMLSVVSLNIFGTTPMARTTVAGTAPRLS